MTVALAFLAGLIVGLLAMRGYLRSERRYVDARWREVYDRRAELVRRGDLAKRLLDTLQAQAKELVARDLTAAQREAERSERRAARSARQRRVAR